MRTFAVWGIRRTGNHAIIGWLLDGIGGPSVHFNDIGTPEDPAGSAVHVGLRDVSLGPFKRGALRKLKYFVHTPRRLEIPGRDPNVDYLGLGGSAVLRCRVFSYEDHFLTDYRGRPMPYFGSGSAGDVTTVVIVRDPFNLTASLMKSSLLSRSVLDLPALIDDYGRVFRERHRLGIVGINFNEWTRSGPYRKAIAAELGFESDGSPYREVSATGSGSSFSGVSFHGKADAMEVTARWRHYAGDDTFRRLVLDPRVRQLAEEVFPDLAAEVYEEITRD